MAYMVSPGKILQTFAYEKDGLTTHMLDSALNIFFNPVKR